MESVWNELGGGEGIAGRSVPLSLAGPVGLTHHEAKLRHPGLGPPLLNVSPPHLTTMLILHGHHTLGLHYSTHPLLTLSERLGLCLQLQPVLNGVVLGQFALHLLSSTIQAG